MRPPTVSPIGSRSRPHPLAQITGTFDIVVANILAPVLIELAPDLRRLVAPSGVLIISGVLADRHEHVETALRPLQRMNRTTLDGWAALTLTDLGLQQR